MRVGSGRAADFVRTYFGTSCGDLGIAVCLLAVAALGGLAWRHVGQVELDGLDIPAGADDVDHVDDADTVAATGAGGCGQRNTTLARSSLDEPDTTEGSSLIDRRRRTARWSLRGRGNTDRVFHHRGTHRQDVMAPRRPRPSFGTVG